MTYVVAAKCSGIALFLRNTYKTVKSLKLHFLHISPLVQLYTSVSDCKGFGSVAGSHAVKRSSAVSSHC
jgi:hypothetical protein